MKKNELIDGLTDRLTVTKPSLHSGWYVSLVLKPVFGVGRFDSLAMEFHHFVTLALIIWSYTTGFTQIGECGLYDFPFLFFACLQFL